MKQLTDEVRDAQFEAWWEKSGQFCRTGGSAYEKTFAYTAWLAALDAAQPVQVNEMLVEALEKLLPMARRHGTLFGSSNPWTEACDIGDAALTAALTAAKQAKPERAPSTKGSDQVWFAQSYGIKQGGQQ